MIRRVLAQLYMLRVQIAGFLLQWPLSGWAFQTPLLRGLADIGNREVGMVSQLAAVQSVYLAITANLVLLWGRARLDGERVAVPQPPGQLLGPRRFISLASLLFWTGFMADVRTRSTASHFWAAAIGNLVLVLFCAVAIEELLNAFPRRCAGYRFFLLPLPGLWTDSFRWGRAYLVYVFRWVLRVKIPRRVWRTRRWILRRADRVLGPGFLDYRGMRPRGMLPGHGIALALLVLMFVTFEDSGLQFLNSGSFAYRYRLIAPCTLSMALSGALFVISVLANLAFFADRYRIPLSLVLLGWITVSTWLAGVDHLFWSEPVSPSQLGEALSPGQVLELAPKRFVVVAAAGGGIQSSGWTAQVLSGLQEDEQGPAFKRAVRVVSGVSGGALGTIFYLGTYDGVWGKAYPPAEARRRAMASSLDAVAWGLVYPDLHRLFLPVPGLMWRDADRGWALERSFAQRAGRYPGPTLLSLGPLVRSGLPVVLLNSTLTAEAMPVVFTNSRFPGPETGSTARRGIRSFHDDFRLETRLETATRLSATFPLISPAARPSELKGKNAFVDGGYFDNSGLYSLMGWLEQAGMSMPPSAPPREVLLLQIDAFPEEPGMAARRAEFSWYRQLTIPFETVVGVRESGQAERNRNEFPLLAKSLEGRLNVHLLEFRFRPSPRCALEPPPLSWHLSQLEQQCIAEAWTDPRIVESRRAVAEWLAGL
ncbi:MAG: patatin-like phospholipase family protein [Candidatus Solibacter usitatus]|nr:patatin-like phospholipase family protein [Candidatus Solibacter usitatus]